MTETASKLKNEVLKLSVCDRAELAHVLIHSLDEGEDVDAERAWDDELQRRMNEIEMGREVGQSAQSVFAQLKEKYSS